MRKLKLCLKTSGWKCKVGTLEVKVSSLKHSLIQSVKPILFSHYPCASSCLDWEGPDTKATHTLRVVLSDHVLPKLREGGK